MKEALAGLPPILDFQLHTRRRELGKVKFQRLKDADQNRSSSRTTNGLAGAPGSAVHRCAAQGAFSFIVGAGCLGMQHKREQFFVTHQPHNVMHQIAEFVIRSFSVRLSGIVKILHGERFDGLFHVFAMQAESQCGIKAARNDQSEFEVS